MVTINHHYSFGITPDLFFLQILTYSGCIQSYASINHLFPLVCNHFSDLNAVQILPMYLNRLNKKIRTKHDYKDNVAVILRFSLLLIEIF